MSIFTQLARTGRAHGKSNVERMLEVEDDDLLVQIPRSKYMLRCREWEDNQWRVDVLNPYTLDTVNVHEELSTDDFQSLLLNIFSVMPQDNMLYHAVKEEYRSLHN